MEVARCKVGPFIDFPCIKPSSWVGVLDKRDCLHHLFGLGEDFATLEAAKPKLLEFWAKYELSHGGHQVYDLASSGKLDLGNCLPIYLHGDEGVTFKKEGALVVSFYSPLGQGVACRRVGQLDGSATLEMHFLGHCFKTRFVMATMMKVEIEQFLFRVVKPKCHINIPPFLGLD